MYTCKLFHNSSIGQFPSLVSLQFRHDWNPDHPFHSCGGTIISKTHVLSAAHCFVPDATQPEKWLVVAGSIIPKTSKTSYHVKKIKPHPEYNQRSTIYDIAILVIEGEFQLSNNTKVMAMANSFQKDIGIECLKNFQILLNLILISTAFSIIVYLWKNTRRKGHTLEGRAARGEGGGGLNQLGYLDVISG